MFVDTVNIANKAAKFDVFIPWWDISSYIIENKHFYSFNLILTENSPQYLSASYHVVQGVWIHISKNPNSTIQIYLLSLLLLWDNDFMQSLVSELIQHNKISWIWQINVYSLKCNSLRMKLGIRAYKNLTNKLTLKADQLTVQYQ